MGITEINETRSYLAFELDKEIFGVDVLQVREILEYTTITRIQQLPDYISVLILF